MCECDVRHVPLRAPRHVAHTYSVTFPLRNLSPPATTLCLLPLLLLIRHCLHLFSLFFHSVRQFEETNISERSLNLLINYVKISVCPFGPNCCHTGQVPQPGQQFSGQPRPESLNFLWHCTRSRYWCLLLLLTCQRGCQGDLPNCRYLRHPRYTVRNN